MAENKKSFLLYCNWIELFEDLTDQEAGKLIKHIFRYVNDLNPESDDPVIKFTFPLIKAILKTDLEKYKGICLKNAENAKKRWHKNNATVSDRIRSDAKHADKDTDKDIDTDKEIDKDIKDRDSNFKKELFVYLKDYSEEMLNNFYLYWSEPNKSKTKMKFETQKTWDLSRRLKRWSNNNFGNNGNGTNKSKSTQSVITEDELREFSEGIANDPDLV